MTINIDLSGALLILLIMYTLVTAVVNLKKRKALETMLYVIALVLQIFILFFNFQEKNKQRVEILELKKGITITTTLSSINEPNPNISDAISALVRRNEQTAKNTINEAYNSQNQLYNIICETAERHKKNGDYMKSQIYFKLCSFIKGNDPKVIFNLAILERYISGGKKNDEIIKSIKKALELDPKITDAHIFLGKIFVTTGDLSKAESHFKAALRLENNEEAMKNLAYFYFSNNKYDEATELFENLIQKNSDEADYYYTLSNCYYEKKSYQDAKVFIDKALKLDQDNSIYLSLKVSILENPDYREPIPIANLFETDQGTQEPEELIQDSSESEIESEENEEIVETEKTKKTYPSIKATICNASKSKRAANDLGFKLRKEYGIRYAVVRTRRRYKDTVIYYDNPNDKIIAEEFEKRIGGTQKVAPLPTNVKITRYKDIVIFIGNDYAKVLKF